MSERREGAGSQRDRRLARRYGALCGLAALGALVWLLCHASSAQG